MKRIFRLFRQRRGVFLLTLFCCIGGVGITLLWNSELAVIIDGVQEGRGIGTERITYCGLLVVLAAFLQGGMQFFSAYAGEYAVHDLRMGLARRIMRKKYSEVAKESAAELVSVQQNEMEEVNQYISDNLFTLCSTAVNFIFTLVFLLTQNAVLTFFYIAPVIGLAVYTTVSGKMIYRYTRREQEALKKMNGVTGTLLSLFPVIRIYEAERLLRKNYAEHIDGWQEAAVAQERMKARLMSLSGMLSCLPLVVLMLAGGTMVVKGNLSMGMLYVFVNLSGNVSGVMINIAAHLANFRRFCGNLDRVWEKIDEKGEEKDEYFVTRDLL